MPIYPLRKLPALPVAGLAEQWLERIGADLKSGADRALMCRRILCEMTYPGFAASWETAVEDTRLPLSTRLALSSLDPRNVTLEPEYYAECDDARFQRVKPLLWLWYSFDRNTARGAERRARRPPQTPARAVHLQALRRKLQGVPVRGILVRLQHGSRRQRRGPPERAA